MNDELSEISQAFVLVSVYHTSLRCQDHITVYMLGNQFVARMPWVSVLQLAGWAAVALAIDLI